MHTNAQLDWTLAASRLAHENVHAHLQVNATGVMPVIFASSLLAAPTALARYFNTPAFATFAKAISPAGGFYLPVSVHSLGFLVPSMLFIS